MTTGQRPRRCRALCLLFGSMHVYRKFVGCPLPSRRHGVLCPGVFRCCCFTPSQQQRDALGTDGGLPIIRKSEQSPKSFSEEKKRHEHHILLLTSHESRFSHWFPFRRILHRLPWSPHVRLGCMARVCIACTQMQHNDSRGSTGHKLRMVVWWDEVTFRRRLGMCGGHQRGKAIGPSAI
jgi:hypothetical protein